MSWRAVRSAGAGLSSHVGASVRALAALAVAVVVVVAGCGDPEDTESLPQDPYSEVVSFSLEIPARAVAVLEELPASPEPAPESPRALFALAREIQSDVQIVAADGGGGLLAMDPVPTGAGPRDVVSLDIDGDGRLDLVTADTAGSTLTALRRDETGSFVPFATVPLALAPRSLAVADIDLDGRPDLVAVVGLDPKETGVLAWTTAKGALAPIGDFIPVPGAVHVTGGDLDADGDMDVGVTTADGWVALRNDQSAFELGAELISDCIHPRASAIDDLDGDGVGELLLACEGQLLLVRDPMGEAVRESLGPAGNLYDVVAADLDDNGTVDVAACDPLEHVVRLWLSPGGSSVQAFVHPVARGPIALGVVDLERDGDVDLWVLGYEERRLDVLVSRPPK